MAILHAMIMIYADLVEAGLRALEPNEKNIPVIPTRYIEPVKAELERRKNEGTEITAE